MSPAANATHSAVANWRASHTAATPLPQSSKPTMSPITGPIARRAFVPPVLPLPTCSRSTPHIFPNNLPQEIAPNKYAATSSPMSSNTVSLLFTEIIKTGGRFLCLHRSMTLPWDRGTIPLSASKHAFPEIWIIG